MVKVGGIYCYNNVVWVKALDVREDNCSLVKPIHKEDIESGRFEEYFLVVNSLLRSKPKNT